MPKLHTDIYGDWTLAVEQQFDQNLHLHALLWVGSLRNLYERLKFRMHEETVMSDCDFFLRDVEKNTSDLPQDIVVRMESGDRDNVLAKARIRSPRCLTSLKCACAG